MSGTGAGRTGTRGISVVLTLLVDGMRADVLHELLQGGALPNIQRHIVAPGSSHRGVTVFPSVTDVAYLPMLTGQYPGTANIPGVRWVDKERFAAGRLFLNGHRSYIGIGHRHFTEDLPDTLETLFELCPDSLAMRSNIHRGLSAGSNLFWSSAIPFMFFSHYLKRSDFIDRIGVRGLLRAMGRLQDGAPRLVFVPLLDVDTSSHNYGPTDRRTLAAYRRVDAAVGALVGRLMELGVWGRTHVLLTSDHGHSATDRHVDLNRLLSRLGYRVFEYPYIYRRSADAAVMVSGNAFANIYLASEGGWNGPLDDGHLEGEHGPLVETLRRSEGVEWVAYRHRPGGVKVASASGTALLGVDGDCYTYSYQDADPLRTGGRDARVRREDALSGSFDGEFPDALEQLWHLFTSRRAGDIVATSKPGHDLRGWRERPEHRSSHGALCREQMVVPVLSSLPLAQDGPVRTADLFPTMAESLGVTPTMPHYGRSLW